MKEEISMKQMAAALDRFGILPQDEELMWVAANKGGYVQIRRNGVRVLMVPKDGN